MIHQVMLCNVIGLTAYGILGTFIALIYAVARIINGGLDSSLSPFFRIATQSKTHFKKIIGTQLALHVMVLCITTLCLFLLLHNKATSHLIPLSIQHISTISFIAGGILIIAAGVHRTTRIILQLAFMYKKVALIEMGSIASYAGIVWIGYLVGYELSVAFLIIPLVLTLLVSIGFLLTMLYNFYHSLPHESKPLPQQLSRRIIKARTYNYLNQLTNQLFSSNIMIPLFGAIFDIKQAGILTLTSFFSYFIQRTFGTASSITWSHVREEETGVKQEFFKITTYLLYYVLIATTIIVIINYRFIMHLFVPSLATTSLLPAYTYLIISLSEHFLMPYQKFLINEEKSHYFFLFNIANIALLVCALYQWWHLPPLLFLVAIVIVRLFTIGLFALFSFRWWGIKPSTDLPLKHFIGITALSGSFAYVVSILN